MAQLYIHHRPVDDAAVHDEHHAGAVPGPGNEAPQHRRDDARDSRHDGRPDGPVQSPSFQRGHRPRVAARHARANAAHAADARCRSVQELQRSPRPPGRRQAVADHRRGDDAKHWAWRRRRGTLRRRRIRDPVAGNIRRGRRRDCRAGSEPLRRDLRPTGNRPLQLEYRRRFNRSQSPEKIRILCMAAADQALYRAKELGRDRIEIAPSRASKLALVATALEHSAA